MTIRSILLEQLEAVYDRNHWFVCFEIAVKDLTEAEVHRKGEDGHSIFELVHHLYFYNERYLCKFLGEEVQELPRNYNTFQARDAMDWSECIADFRKVMLKFRKEITACSEEKLTKWGGTLTHLFIHNAYHIGQIVSIRKQKKWWSTHPVVNG